MIKLGDLDFTNIKQGSTDIVAVYLADEMIWGGSQPSSDFDVRLTLTGGTIENHTYSSGTIPNNEFQNRFDIVGVEMGSGITSIGNGAFYRCSGITQVEIGESVTHIGLYAFWYCTSVSSATLGNSLVSVDEFGLAFYSSAITSIEFPSTLTILGNNSLRGLASITSITCNAATAPSLRNNVFLDSSSNGTLYVPLGSDYSSWIGTSATSGDKLASGWTIQYMGGYSQEYLTFVAETDNMSVDLTNAGNNVFQYSTDSGSTWNNLANSQSTTSVNSGQTIMFKASSPTVSTSNGIGILKPSAYASVEGNVMSLIYGDDFIGQETIEDWQFRSLFSGATNITSAEHLALPSTTLTNYCYYEMFRGCTSLTTAPQLPSTTLANYCYYEMFGGCTSLTTAPQLPSTTLTNGCYSSMFRGCTSLTTAPQLPATTLEESCYKNMFNGCRNLTTAPQLPATTLEESCYKNMFRGCTSLNSITCLATRINARNCLSSWVNDVASNGTFTKAASMTDWPSGASGIPNGWTVQDAV